MTDPKDAPLPRHWLAAMAIESTETMRQRESDAKWTVGEESPTSSTGGSGSATRIESQKSHFDPDPRPLEKSTYGFVWCRPCEAPVSVAGHECREVIP